MRRSAWIWLAGCLAWSADFAANAWHHRLQQAELALLLALLFGIAYAFYRNQPR